MITSFVRFKVNSRILFLVLLCMKPLFQTETFEISGNDTFTSFLLFHTLKFKIFFSNNSKVARAFSVFVLVALFTIVLGGLFLNRASSQNSTVYTLKYSWFEIGISKILPEYTEILLCNVNASMFTNLIIRNSNSTIKNKTKLQK